MAKKKKSSTAKKEKKSSMPKKGKKSSMPKKTKKPNVAKKTKKKENANGPYTPNICSDFTGDNGHQVQFQGIPAGGCTLGQNGPNYVFPFSPNLTGGNGLKYTNLQPGDITTISVPALNQQYKYLVNCCPPDQGVHTVTVP
jgi:hypothetical protein